jgi:uncharacterized tellurite resistance protein B-like protein
MTKQTPWNSFIAKVSMCSNTAHTKLEQDNFALDNKELDDVIRAARKYGDRNNFVDYVINKRNELGL